VAEAKATAHETSRPFPPLARRERRDTHRLAQRHSEECGGASFWDQTAFASACVASSGTGHQARRPELIESRALDQPVPCQRLLILPPLLLYASCALILKTLNIDASTAFAPVTRLYFTL